MRQSIVRRGTVRHKKAQINSWSTAKNTIRKVAASLYTETASTLYFLSLRHENICCLWQPQLQERKTNKKNIQVLKWLLKRRAAYAVFVSAAGNGNVGFSQWRKKIEYGDNIAIKRWAVAASVLNIQTETQRSLPEFVLAFFQSNWFLYLSVPKRLQDRTVNWKNIAITLRRRFAFLPSVWTQFLKIKRKNC